MSDLHPQLLRDAFAVLDLYSTDIANRDPVKSLNEDRSELLRRVRTALDALIFDGTVRRDDVAEIAQRIDDVLIAPSILCAEAGRRALPASIPSSADNGVGAALTAKRPADC